MRTFGLSEFLFIVQAAQWTLALSAIAFVGGALLGLVVALSRTSENAAAVSYTHLTLPTKRIV